MGMSRSEKDIDRLQRDQRQITRDVMADLQREGALKRFADSPLAQADRRFSGITSFLPQGMRSSIPTQYQGMQGQMYANYQTPQKLGEQLTPFGMRPGQSAPVQTGGIGSVSTPLTPPAQDTTKDDDDGFTVDQEQILANINIQRINAGLEPFDSYQDFLSTIDESLPDNIRLPMGMGMSGGSIDIPRPGGISGLDIMNMQNLNIPSMNFDEASIGVGFKEGGVASLNVDKMPGGMDLYGGEEEKPSLGGIGGLASLTKEQLIALLKSKGMSDLGQSSSPGPITPLQQGKEIGQGIRQGAQAIGKLLGIGAASGGLMSLAAGGDVDFPRMNGPISGPGTETSDDIPAMLSDGEFVVNAKAVRGIGKIGGANKSKADQRREGAKMMYALQRAGEKAMRGASK